MNRSEPTDPACLPRETTKVNNKPCFKKAICCAAVFCFFWGRCLGHGSTASLRRLSGERACLPIAIRHRFGVPANQTRNAQIPRRPKGGHHGDTSWLDRSLPSARLHPDQQGALLDVMHRPVDPPAVLPAPLIYCEGDGATASGGLDSLAPRLLPTSPFFQQFYSPEGQQKHRIIAIKPSFMPGCGAERPPLCAAFSILAGALLGGITSQPRADRAGRSAVV